MTKQEFLDGKIFKTHTGSSLEYKYSNLGNISANSGAGYVFQAVVSNVTDDGFTATCAMLGEMFYKEVKFKDLTLNGTDPSDMFHDFYGKTEIKDVDLSNQPWDFEKNFKNIKNL